MTRAELIARMEAAEGPSRELDCAIAEFLRPEFRKKPWRRDKWHDRHYDDSDPHGMHYEIVPHYTASIDAALTLVPNDMWWHHCAGRTRADEPLYGAIILWPGADPQPPYACDEVGSGEHQTSPALALCIAALKAGEKA